MGIKPKYIVVVIMAMMIMISSCLAARNMIPRENNQESEKISREMIMGKEEDSTEKIEHPRSSVENHHYIPRQDFNYYVPGGDNNGGGGGGG
ncbi:hypothetical protein ISN44_As10g012950 [Arabidopsis suecica]|uniref:Uncharacterized protein n=1 Tax=Arabidopsis suecica TaxID=45249 RepID=A0A8T1ZWI0_ARASU|nr:hypothetical protein ISN44_As10g012950 [Arabidopsis suecica]